MPVSAQNDYHDLICSYSWDCAKAIMVARCESTMNPNAYAAGNYGLMQINRIHAPRFADGDPTLFYDPAFNIEVAHQLYMERGWQPWGFCGRQ